MLYVFVMATLISISLIVKREKGSVIGLFLWLVTIAVWILNSYLQLEFLLIALGTVWTVLVLVWIFMINRQKEGEK